MKKLYLSSRQSKIIERIVKKKRKEIVNTINNYFNNETFKHALDVGTTSDTTYEHSNYIIKNLKNIKIFKSISTQKIRSKFFLHSLRKSITNEFTKNEVSKFSSDIVISNATIEHVGSTKNQIKMISNIISLAKKNLLLSLLIAFTRLNFIRIFFLFTGCQKKSIEKFFLLLAINFYQKKKI